MKKITIQKSETADTRTCDVSKVSNEQLLKSSRQHIDDVGKGMWFFSKLLFGAAKYHDLDKISGIDHFHSDFVKKFKDHGWLDNHYKVSRHHLLIDEGIPEDVNLIDVIETIVDCVMAGMGRSGDVYPLDIDPAVLLKAFQNTVNMLNENVVVSIQTPTP